MSSSHSPFAIGACLDIVNPIYRHRQAARHRLFIHTHTWPSTGPPSPVCRRWVRNGSRAASMPSDVPATTCAPRTPHGHHAASCLALIGTPRAQAGEESVRAGPRRRKQDTRHRPLCSCFGRTWSSPRPAPRVESDLGTEGSLRLRPWRNPPQQLTFLQDPTLVCPSRLASPGVPCLPRASVHTATAQATTHNRQKDGCLLSALRRTPHAGRPKRSSTCHRCCSSRWADARRRRRTLTASARRTGFGCFGCFRRVRRARRRLVTSPQGASVGPGKPLCPAYKCRCR